MNLIGKYLNEEVSDAQELVTKVELIIKKHLPKSFSKVKFNNGIWPSITIWFAIGGEKKDWSNGIIENDPGYSIIHIGGFDREGNMTGNMEMTANQIGYRDTKTFKKDKIGWRDINKGDVTKVLGALDKYFGRLKDMVQ